MSAGTDGHQREHPTHSPARRGSDASVTPSASASLVSLRKAGGSAVIEGAEAVEMREVSTFEVSRD